MLHRVVFSGRSVQGSDGEAVRARATGVELFEEPGSRSRTSAARRLTPVAQAAFLLLAVMIVLANLLADLVYVKLDPRVTYT